MPLAEAPVGSPLTCRTICWAAKMKMRPDGINPFEECP
jgi:hypothetical protein